MSALSGDVIDGDVSALSGDVSDGDMCQLCVGELSGDVSHGDVTGSEVPDFSLEADNDLSDIFDTGWLL